MEVFSFSYSIPYVFIYLLLFLLALVEVYLIQSEKKYVKVVSFIILIFFFGFRGYVGSDFTSYVLWYQQVKPISEMSFNSWLGDIYEPGFVLFTSFIKQINDNYHFFIFCNTIIDFLLLYLIIQRYCPNKGALLLFFYFIFLGEFEINLLRNIKSILLFIYSLKYIYDRNFAKYLVLNLIGLAFHATAIFFIPFYFILRFGGKKSLLVIFLIGNIIYFLKIKFILFFATKLGSVIGGVYQARAEHYTDSTTTSGITFSYIYIFVIFILLYFNFDQIRRLSKFNFLIFNLFAFYCICYLYLNEIEVFKSRFGTLFIFSVCLLLSEIISIYKKSIKRLILFPMIFFLFLSKVVVTNSVSPTMYDNLLFGILSYEERRENMNSFSGTNDY